MRGGSLTSNGTHLKVSMVASQVRRLRMRIRMRGGHGLAMELARASGGFAIDGGELILGVIVEGILQTLLDVAAAVGLMLDIPSCGAPECLLGRKRIGVAKL